jgi:hypothetical protein
MERERKKYFTLHHAAFLLCVFWLKKSLASLRGFLEEFSMKKMLTNFFCCSLLGNIQVDDDFLAFVESP